MGGLLQGADGGSNWRKPVNLIAFGPEPVEHGDKLLHFPTQVFGSLATFGAVDGGFDNLPGFFGELHAPVLYAFVGTQCITLGCIFLTMLLLRRMTIDSMVAASAIIVTGLSKFLFEITSGP